MSDAFTLHTTNKAFLLHAGSKAFVGHAPVAPPVPLDVGFTLTNHSGAAVTQPRMTMGHAFAKGDIPAGSRVALFGSDGTTPIAVQQDRESYWSDGSLRFAALSFVSPYTFTDGQNYTYRLKSAVGAPNRAPGSNTLAALTAAHDVKLAFTGPDAGAIGFVASTRTIANLGPASPAFGTNPLHGYEVIRQGPTCCEWRFWSYIKDPTAADNVGYHAWVKATLWVRAWADGTLEISGLVSHGNSWGPHPGGVWDINGGDPPRFAAIIALSDNGTVLRTFGGPADPASFTIPASAFDGSTGYITMPYAAFREGQCCMFTGSGVPSGIAQSTFYVPRWNSNNPSGATTGRYELFDHRFFEGVFGNPVTSQDGSDPYSVWQPNHAYSYYYDVVTRGAGIRYWCSATTGDNTSGTVGPSGTGTITDNNVTWISAGPAFGTPGSGTATVSPLPTVYLHTAFPLADINGDPIWTGTGARPRMVASFDLPYLFAKTRIMPPFRQFNDDGSPVVPGAYDIGALNSNYPNIYQANAEVGWDLNITGDNPGDDRVGYLNFTAQNALYTDEIGWDVRMRCMALTWAGYWQHFEDERAGWWVTVNNGPGGAGTPYPNLGPPMPLAFAYFNPDFAAPLVIESATLANKSGYQSRYGSVVDTSHLPAPWAVPYLKTGHDIFMHIGHAENVGALLSLGYRTDPDRFNTSYTLSGRHYYGLSTKDGQVRGLAWGTKLLALVQTLCPAAHPMAPMINDCMADSAAWMVDFGNWMNVHQPGPAAIGVYPAGGSNIQPWQSAFCNVVYGVEAWKGEDANWLAFLTGYFSRWSPSLYDDNHPGGSSYHTGAHQLNISDGTNNPGAITVAGVYQASYGANMVYSPTGISNSDPPGADRVWGTSNYPWYTTDYAMVDYAGMIMLEYAGVPQARGVNQQIRPRIAQIGGAPWWSGKHTPGGMYTPWDTVFTTFGLEPPP